MKQVTLFLLFGLIFIQLNAQNTAQIPASCMIPKPITCNDLAGYFNINNASIGAPKTFADVAKLLSEQLKTKNELAKAGHSANIVFEKIQPVDGLNDEGYHLSISSKRVLIQASSIKGAIHGAFTLTQLQLLQPDNTTIPCAEITDSPRFGYRGMHLDVSRNFFPLSFIKKYIDLMALYKYNTFHWHLTDDPGWRLEIKKYPALTKTTAFRPEQKWTEWSRSSGKFSEEGNPNAYGGYYTQDDAREIVAYAARRGISVIPEIEMPGHSYEVMAAFPQLCCSEKPYQNSEFCIGNPETYTFLENILTEVMAVFPSTYIHVGGDEANSEPWSKCQKCQKLKKENGLKSEDELQAYLMKHIEKFLKEHGRKLIGWDEIVDGGLPADATVMSWRGMNGGVTAIKQGHDVIMTPGECYLDHYQSDPATQPEAIGGYLTLDGVYNFDPQPNEIQPNEVKHLLGTQANLWTEYMPTTYQVEYMAYPRAIALSEVAWSKKETRNFADFQRRLQAHYLLMQRMNINYYRPSTSLTVIALPDSEKKQDEISFVTEQYKPEMHYTIDGSNPTSNSPLYTEHFYTSGKTEIKAAFFKDGVPIGNPTTYTADYHKAIGKKVQYNIPWSTPYPAQKESTLTNGIRGSATYGDHQWMGFDKDFDVTVDMGEIQPISSVEVQFMHLPGPGIYLPQHLELQTSSDGTNFTSFQKLTHDFDPKNRKLAYKTFEFNCNKKEIRYLRLIGPNNMKGYLFVDEIVIY